MDKSSIELTYIPIEPEAKFIKVNGRLVYHQNRVINFFIKIKLLFKPLKSYYKGIPIKYVTNNTNFKMPYKPIQKGNFERSGRRL